MKKLLILFLCTFVILSITACGVFTEREAEVGFIDEALLSDFRVADFPVPTGDVRHIDDKAYVNMTDVEYGNYADEVMAYLLSKDDIYHKGYHYETGFAGGIFFIPEYRFSQLREDTDSSVGWFIFSLTEALNEGDEYNHSYWNGVFVKVYRDSGSFGSFEYNTVIEICESYCAVRGVASHSEHTYEYVGNDYTHQKVYTCGCGTPDIAEMHVDYDEDNFCDLCQNEHKHVYTPWYNNETYHWNVGDCLWNACDLGTYAEHYDNDGDCICDACDYDLPVCEHQWDDGIELEGGSGAYVMEYTCSLCGSKRREHITIIPPEICFLRNLTGCEWLNEITAEDIAQIKIISGAVGVAPGSLNNVSSSTDEAVISRIFEEYYWLDTTPISKMEGEIDGGGGVTVKFILKDGTSKELYINNGNYRDPDGNYFELLSTPKFKDTDNASKAYGFITYIGIGTVYDKDNNAVCEIPIDELEFDYDLDLDLPDLDPYNYVLKTEFGNLEFISPDIFYMESGEACVLVGKNLDELISHATAIDYSLVMNDEEWLYEDLKSSYKAGDTVTVKIDMAIDLGYLFLVNGEDIADCRDVDGLYWEFSFTMPACDVDIDFKTYDGFLPDRNYGILIETYWKQNLESDYVYVENYYGEFPGGAIVAMIASGGYDDAIWEETVGEITIRYCNGNRILVLYEGEFYTLTDAYNNGYITAEDLTDIAAKHMEFHPYLFE